MMHRMIAATALLAVSLPAAADRLVPASPERVRAHVEFLADDLLEGRGAGSRGYDIAARYVATQFRLLGLQPAGDAGGWNQAVPLLESTRVVPAGRFTIERGGSRTELVPAEDFIPGHNFLGSDATVTAPVAYVGHGILAPGLGHDDFAGIELKGKIALVLNGAPARFPHGQRAHYSSGSNKNAELVRRGAVGVIHLNTPEDEKRGGWDRAVRLSWVPRMRLLDAAGQPLDAFPELRVSASLNIASAPKLFAGAMHTPEEAFAAAADGKPMPFDLPVTVTLRSQAAIARTQSANVVGLLRGSDESLRDEYVVLTAHLDHIGRGAAVNGDTIYNGAFDNATGIAVLLEAARTLAQSPVKPRRSVLFVAVTAEEKGLLGSDYFARNPTVPLASIVANVNMDMPVVMWPASNFTAFGAEHSTLGEVARKALAAEKLAMSPDEQPEEVIFVRSDQYSFVKRGIPSLYLDNGNGSTDASVDVKARTKEFLRTNYHMPSDQASLPIHYPSLAKLARVNARIALAIANERRRPAWLPGDFFGEVYGRPNGR
ncbi:MAG: M20/M25/M40 family metallo-hydrolase [Gammaproteobacteria bacterium]|nr:M20/M25/M40 family metallo-hydrolase [Gammaproteobacteria bacterium]